MYIKLLFGMILATDNCKYNCRLTNAKKPNTEYLLMNLNGNVAKLVSFSQACITLFASMHCCKVFHLQYLQYISFHSRYLITYISFIL